MMGVLCGIGRIVDAFAFRIPDAFSGGIQLRHTHSHGYCLSGSGILCNIAVPGGKASHMGFDMFPVDPHPGIAVHAVKADQHPVSREILRHRDLPLVVVFVVGQHIKSLHQGFSGNQDVLPVFVLPGSKVKILIFLCGVGHSILRGIVRNLVQEFPGSISLCVIETHLRLADSRHAYRSVRDHRCLVYIAADLYRFCLYRSQGSGRVLRRFRGGQRRRAADLDCHESRQGYAHASLPFSHVPFSPFLVVLPETDAHGPGRLCFCTKNP